MQERRNSIANAMELRLSCTNTLIWYILYNLHHMNFVLYLHMIYLLCQYNDFFLLEWAPVLFDWWQWRHGTTLLCHSYKIGTRLISYSPSFEKNEWKDDRPRGYHEEIQSVKQCFWYWTFVPVEKSVLLIWNHRWNSHLTRKRHDFVYGIWQYKALSINKLKPQ